MFRMLSGLLRTTASRRPRKVSQPLALVLADNVFFHVFAAYSASAVDYNYMSTLYSEKKAACGSYGSPRPYIVGGGKYVDCSMQH